MQTSKLLILIFVLILFSCKNDPDSDNYRDHPEKNISLEYLQLKGPTMGTQYVITYGDPQKRNFQKAIDAVLVAVNADASVYEKESVISHFNQSKGDIPFPVEAGSYFEAIYNKAAVVYQQSGGAFDPTVMPVVNYWGFGWTEKRAVTLIDSLKVDSLKQSIGFQKIKYVSNTLAKSHPAVQLDFGGIAKGYGVDVICEFLEAKGINDYWVDIGGDLRVKGKNPKGNKWKVGVNTPKPGRAITDVEVIVQLENRALASSGNYRNYYQVDGKKYGHTINPLTGYPEKSNLLGASVFANDCATADAYATTFMVLGLDKAYDLALQIKAVEALLIYGDENGSLLVKYTPGLEDVIVD